MNDQLNKWEYCNPNNFSDKLPEPYRFINKIIQKDILLEVYNKLFLIEKYRSDPNYEGALRTLPPQGIFDISNITSISKNSSNLQVAAGDQMGNIMILDMSKKTRLCKKEIGSKRINKISLGTRDGANDDQKAICIIGVVCHLDPVVQIYRYKPGENKIMLAHTITITKNTSQIGELPIDIEISKYSQYVIITQYNGGVLVYKIPEIKIENAVTQTSTNTQSQNTLLPPIKGSVKEQPKPQITQQATNGDLAVTEITEIFYSIQFQGIKKELKFDEIVNQLKETSSIPKEQPVAKEDPKKKAPAAVPQQPKKGEPVQQVKEETDIEENNNSYQIKSQQKDGIDISEDYPLQKFKPCVDYLLEKVSVQGGQKAFDNFKQHDVVVGLVVSWSNTTRVELHYLNQAKRSYLPLYIQGLFNQNIKSQSLALPSITKPTAENRIIQIPMLYPVSCSTVSKGCLQLAIGMQQGSVLIYDLVYQQEKFYLDKHKTIITHIEFCEDNRLITGSIDGEIHIYNTKEGTTLCKRTNQFRKGTKVNYDDQKQGLWRIVSLAVSDSGVAVVQDNEQEVRLYDLWRGEKIAKLSPIQVMDDQLRKWCEKQIVIRCFRNEILISAQTVTKQQTDNTQNTVQIFKIFDNLVNLFASLSNVYRKGVEKEKIMNLFERIGKEDLQNPQFEVPNLVGSQSQVALKVPGQDSKTLRGSQILRHGSQMSQSKVQQSKVSVSMQSQYALQPKMHESSVSKNQLHDSALHGSQSKLQYGHKESNQSDPYQFRPASLNNSLHKSSQSERYDYNSSFRSTHSPQNSLHVKAQKEKKSTQGLTKEMLHPEEYLLERDKSQIPQLVYENSSMVDHCRNRNSDKMLRSEKVTSSLLKIGQRLAVEDEKMKLQERYRNLQKVK